MEKLKEKKAEELLKKGYSKAKEILEDNDEIKDFLQKLDIKLKTIHITADDLAKIPLMISLVKSYVKKEYPNIPTKTIIAIISALGYWLSPIDFCPDPLPIIGYIDDAAVVAFCLKLVGDDIEKYQKWREENNKVLNDK